MQVHVSLAPGGYRSRRAADGLSSALLNAGYDVSRSHAAQGSIKTSAPRSFVYDAVREFIKKNPVKMDKIAEGSPARRLLEKPMTYVSSRCSEPTGSKRVTLLIRE
jgi:tRNA (guanine26-N2/guanine27-N2)-dimethyltransferase